MQVALLDDDVDLGRFVVDHLAAAGHRIEWVTPVSKTARKLPQELYKSLTWDRGKEMAGHKRFTLATDIQVYFCDLRSPWQRGSNENTNGLLRQYLLKGIDISSYSQAKLNAVARQLNERPRKKLG
jgi:IS30 family transposase